MNALQLALFVVTNHATCRPTAQPHQCHDWCVWPLSSRSLRVAASTDPWSICRATIDHWGHPGVSLGCLGRGRHASYAECEQIRTGSHWWHSQTTVCRWFVWGSARGTPGDGQHWLSKVSKSRRYTVKQQWLANTQFGCISKTCCKILCCIYETCYKIAHLQSYVTIVLQRIYTLNASISRRICMLNSFFYNFNASHSWYMISSTILKLV